MLMTEIPVGGKFVYKDVLCTVVTPNHFVVFGPKLYSVKKVKVEYIGCGDFNLIQVILTNQPNRLIFVKGPESEAKKVFERGWTVVPKYRFKALSVSEYMQLVPNEFGLVEDVC